MGFATLAGFGLATMTGGLVGAAAGNAAAGLVVAGAVSGAVVPKHLWAHYVGAVLGQAAYELAFLKLGPLFILGLVFLAVYNIIFVVAAAIVASLRKAGTSENTDSSA